MARFLRVRKNITLNLQETVTREKQVLPRDAPLALLVELESPGGKPLWKRQAGGDRTVLRTEACGCWGLSSSLKSLASHNNLRSSLG